MRKRALYTVNYQRLGLFCYDFDFKANSSMVTVNYELIKDANGWKVTLRYQIILILVQTHC